MSKLLATLIVCIATLALGGCAESAKESHSGATRQDTERNSKLENCVTAVGADRKNCTAK